MSLKEDRDARLDELVKLTKEWAEGERKRLNAQVDMAKRMLKGRTAEKLNQTTVTTAKELLVDEIDSFLLGS